MNNSVIFKFQILKVSHLRTLIMYTTQFYLSLFLSPFFSIISHVSVAESRQERKSSMLWKYILNHNLTYNRSLKKYSINTCVCVISSHTILSKVHSNKKNWDLEFNGKMPQYYSFTLFAKEVHECNILILDWVHNYSGKNLFKDFYNTNLQPGKLTKIKCYLPFHSENYGVLWELLWFLLTTCLKSFFLPVRNKIVYAFFGHYASDT